MLTVKRVDLRETGSPAEMLGIHLTEISDKKGALSIWISDRVGREDAVAEVKVWVTLKQRGQLWEKGEI